MQAFPCSGCGSGCGILTGAAGNFSDGSGANNYGDNANCKWMIAPPRASQVYIKFKDFQTESCCDSVRVWQCLDTSCSGNATLLSTLQGSYPNGAVVTSTTGYVLVQFTSDFSVTSAGFQAHWSSSVVNASALAPVRPTCLLV